MLFRNLAFVICCAAIGCGKSPTEPSAGVAPEVTVAAGALSWQTASGCNPERPFPDIAGTVPTSSVLLGTDRLRALWPGPQTQGRGIYIVDFQAEAPGRWRVCSWSLAVF